jgi:predicted neutral ceramidase superfamily lipid hydrolase
MWSELLSLDVVLFLGLTLFFSLILWEKSEKMFSKTVCFLKVCSNLPVIMILYFSSFDVLFQDSGMFDFWFLTANLAKLGLILYFFISKQNKKIVESIQEKYKDEEEV